MKKIETNLKDCYILEPDKFGDDRGYYSPFFAEKDYMENGLHSIKGIVQGARSKSGKGIVRGLHFQKDPYCQSKIVECLNGAVLDVVVDLRKDSPTYMKWTSVELTPENGRQLLIPRGFAHGFVSLKDNSLFQYLVDNDYKPSHEDGVLWCDPKINVDWNLEKYGIENPLLSEKDKNRLPLSDNTPDFYTKKRYLVTGASGQLGFDVIKELNKRGIYDILALSSSDLDITDRRLTKKIIEEYAPEVIFHCAAYTNVDKAEDDKEMAMKVNAEGTKNITDAARLVNAKLIYVSTDYVFDGKKDGVYEVNDKVNPQNVYGLSKALGEKIVSSYEKSFIVRTSWVFGINGKNFVKTMLKLAENHSQLNVVSDQIGSPTYTVDLAKLLVDMSQTDKYGIYHANNEGFTSWADFAEYIFKSNNLDVKVNHVTTKEYGQSKAQRPENSRLSKKCLIENGFNTLPTWQDAIDRYNKELNESLEKGKNR